MELRLKYGNEMVQAEWPDVSSNNKAKSKRPFLELQTMHIATLQKPADIINQALDRPLGSYPFNEVFRRARNVLIVLPSAGEPSGYEHYLPLLYQRLRQLHVPADEIRILVTKAENESEERGLQTLDLPQARVFYHNPRDHKALEYVGLTRRGTPVFVNRLLLDADTVILCGRVTHHPFAGYGGGPRLIVPGCSGEETISRYYAHAMDLEIPRVQARCRDGVIEGNPLQEDAREAFRFVTANFLLHTIWNDQDQLIGAVAGEPLQAFAAGCRAIDDMYCAPLATRANALESGQASEPALLVVASCGGFPQDRDFRTAYPTLHHAVPFARPDGVIILVAECSGGLGSEILSHWCNENPASESFLSEAQNDWLNGPSGPPGLYGRSFYHRLIQSREAEALTALSVLQTARERRIILVSTLAPALVQRLGLIPTSSLPEAFAIAVSHLPEIFSAWVIHHGALLTPRLS
jgi:nickel-dependent lactate racemase